MKLYNQLVFQLVNVTWKYYDPDLLQITYQLFNLIKKYSNEINVFTTNYDRTIEEYCSYPNQKSICINGFKQNEYSHRRLWTGEFTDPNLENITNVYLYKLHGSLTWKKHRRYGIEETSEERRSFDSNYIEHLLIYPTISPKYGEDIEPYKTIRNEFSKFMEIADISIVIGFSFRDEHINKIFYQFIKRGKKLIIVSPSADLNFYTNLLKKDIPEEKELESLERNNEMVGFLRQNKQVLTINHALSIDNIEDITDLINYYIKST